MEFRERPQVEIIVGSESKYPRMCPSAPDFTGRGSWTGVWCASNRCHGKQPPAPARYFDPGRGDLPRCHPTHPRASYGRDTTWTLSLARRANRLTIQPNPAMPHPPMRPYKGAGPALTDLLSGNIQVMFDTLGTALPPVKSGLVRALGVSSTQRSPDLPDVPTIAESGYPDYRVSVWYGIAAPAKLPDDIALKIGASLDRALNDDAFRASLEKIGFPVFRPRSAAAIAEFIDADTARWSGVIKSLNISLD